ncbi:MAG: hypothetical protein V4602_20960 [Pseudomonadota bacterium]
MANELLKGTSASFKTKLLLINRKFTPNQTIQILHSTRTRDLSASDTTDDDCEINRNGAERFSVMKQLREAIDGVCDVLPSSHGVLAGAGARAAADRQVVRC